MTDIPALPLAPAFNLADSGRLSRTALPWRAILLTAVVGSAAAGFVAASAEQISAAKLSAGGELTMLLQFMAIVKAAMSVAAIGLIAWRLAYPVTSSLALAYVASAALMSLAPTMIWQMAHVALGAAAFHIGMVMLLGAAWADRGEVAGIATSAISQLRK